MKYVTCSLMVVLATALSCGEAPDSGGGEAVDPEIEAVLNDVAASYVQLVLAVGQHDPDYVDAYYGPQEWADAASSEVRSLVDLEAEARRLRERVESVPVPVSAEMWALRHAYLAKQLEAVTARVRMLSGTRLTFDAESRALYDAVAPTHEEEHFADLTAALDRRLPGTGPLPNRFESFRSDFIIPPERLDDVFAAAIAACRERTARHVELPADETFVVEYVTDKSWSGYNWYQGAYRSLIQVNTDLPVYIDRALDLACHEGYPGHHVYNVLLERHLTDDRGWVEYSVYPLFSPQSLIAEGSANYGIDVAFSPEERETLEREVLYPLAGLDPDRVAEYQEVMRLVDRLDYAGNEAARRYLDGTIDRGAAAAWLTRFALMPPARAEQRIRFFDQYRSYVINYNLGRDLVREYVESGVNPNATAEARWARFVDLLASPRLPSTLR